MSEGRLAGDWDDSLDRGGDAGLWKLMCVVLRERKAGLGERPGESVPLREELELCMLDGVLERERGRMGTSMVEKLCLDMNVPLQSSAATMKERDANRRWGNNRNL